MSAATCVFVLLSTLCGSTVVSGLLHRPTNVHLTSYNMDLVLKWGAPEGAASSVVYTAEYRSTVSNYRAGCVNISHLECDFSRLNTSISQYGKYSGRVRAQLGAESSDWVESNQINLDKDTVIGSPSVSLFSNGATIDVSITDPVFAVSTLRNAYSIATYNITYWKDGQEEKATSLSNIQQNRVILSELDLWTKYCVKVRINTERNHKGSNPSRTVCERTTSNEGVPWVAAVVTFVVMAIAVILVVVTVVYRKSISHFFCPKDALPQHFKEYLLAPPNSSMYLVTCNSQPPEEIYHQVSIIADNRPVEEGCASETEGTSFHKQSDIAVVER
ncbi:interleukin-10 receptor subunit beta-like [Pempheris klunzingeri]|uniref:interleukin-10 receptor subunit beta-like n=1 Tax=Pempheris klunzingeri TaxID=3127111 RepID=UPI00398018CE